MGKIIRNGWFKVAVFIATTILALCAVVLYVYIAPSGHDDSRNDKKLTERILLESKEIVTLSNNIVGIQIVSFNLANNTRRMIYTYMDMHELNNLYTVHLLTSVSLTYPIFTDDKANNIRITRLLNHEFVCTPYTESITSKLSPESNRYITTICAVAVPPTYGEFTGVVAVLLKAPPDESEVSYLRTVLNELSIKIGNL